MKEEKTSKKNTSATNAIFASGKRKEAIARVKIITGQGDVTINDQPIEQYFSGPADRMIYFKAFDVLSLDPKDYTISIKVDGGGKNGQLEAVRHAIAKTLLAFNPSYRERLKHAKLLHRDPRVKERRKYGMAHKARAKKQSPKR